MTATKNNSIFKKLGALVMAMCLTCALAVSASAAGEGTYSVTVQKTDGSAESMASAAIVGTATVSAVTEGYKVTIPLEPATITKMGIDFTGYIIDFSVNGASDCSVTTAPYTQGSAEMSFVVDSLPADMTFAVTYDVAIYWPNGSYFCNHSDFPGTPDLISSNIILS